VNSAVRFSSYASRQTDILITILRTCRGGGGEVILSRIVLGRVEVVVNTKELTEISCTNTVDRISEHVARRIAGRE